MGASDCAEALRPLPRAVCERRVLGELEADPDAAWWRGVVALDLSESLSGSAPEQPSTLRMAWDGAELRLLFECVDSHVWATLSERDAPLYTEEVVEVFIDPVGDGESYFEIELNPLNTVLDLVLRKTRSGYRKDFAWECEGLRTAVRFTPVGWCAELGIPFRSLSAEPPAVGDCWRVNFYRIDWPVDRERELSAWSPTYRPSFHTPERFGILEFGAPIS